MIQELKKYFNIKNPTFQFSIFLVLFVLASFIDLMIFETTPGLRINYLLAILVTYTITELFWVWNYYSKKIPNLNYLHLGITASILFLLIHPTAPWWMFAIGISLALFFKSMFRYKGQPIFNPAALGVLMTYLVSLPLVNNGILRYPALESWWGADLLFSFAQRLPILWIVPIVLFGGIFVLAKRFNKQLHGIVFFVTYLVFYLVYALFIKNIPLAPWQFFIGTITSSYVFMAFVMVVEPKTSPIIKNQQIWLGIVGGIILFISTNVLPEYVPGAGILGLSTTALLVLNLITFIVKNHRNLMGQKTVVAAPAPAKPGAYTAALKVEPTIKQTSQPVNSTGIPVKK